MSGRTFRQTPPRFFVMVVIISSAVTLAIAQRGRTAQSGPAISNTVQGTIYDDTRQPVADAFVELYSNTGSMIDHQRSASTGRYMFRHLPQGRFTIKVRPFGTNLREGNEDVDLANTFGDPSETVIQDFHLEKDKRFDAVQPSIVGTVYAQDVPDEAHRLYRSGVDNLKTDHARAFSDLEEAIRIFPTYFDALATLGKAYILDAKYEQGYPFLVRAINVNKECGDCFYSLGLTLYKVGQIPEGVRAVSAAAILQPRVPAVRLLEGMLLFLNNDYPGAEKALLAAKSLFKEPEAEVYWYLSLVYNKTHRNKEAADSLEQYLKAKPDLTQTEKDNTKDLIAKLRKSG
jgi:hypothetical protein